MKDFHVHTTFCDGNHTPEEMVIAAIEKGLDTIGFSAHSYTFFDASYCMKKENIDLYKAEINALKEKYSNKIKILCGVEQDYYSDMPTAGFDYVIGSVHYLKVGEEYFSIDDDADILKAACDKYYGGDFYLLCNNYFKTVAKVAKKTNADIIGHFDLVTKFNEKYNFFNENDSKYIAAYRTAVDSLIKDNITFEINTGAISRGYKSTPYPSRQILKYIAEKNGKVILSSDSHSTKGLCFEFEKWSAFTRNMGLNLV